MGGQLADLLFKEYRRRVLGLMLLHPEETYHVREIARLTGTVAGTLHKELARLAEAGILLKSVSGNQVRYGANREGLIFDELASILRKTSGVVDVLAEALAPVADKIRLAFVYGSIASGRQSAGSDVDILIVGTLEFTTAVKLLHPAQTTLKREINPKVFSPSEWQQLADTKDRFFTELMERPKLLVMGEKHEFGELGRQDT
jgi:predicted nucleotidyltransferase